MSRLITFSLWGDQEKYCYGALRNAVLAREFYPGWKCRFYVAEDVPSKWTRELDALGSEIVPMPVGMDGWKGMFARFLPASESDVEVFISRDCDSRLSQREADAVNDWLRSTNLLHVMRDHPHHTTPILGGMWGAKRYAISEMRALIDQWNQEDRWQTDQEFLRDIIWPAYSHKVLAHDDWRRFQTPGSTLLSFPTDRLDDDFVGSIKGANDVRLHPEHHEML